VPWLILHIVEAVAINTSQTRGAGKPCYKKRERVRGIETNVIGMRIEIHSKRERERGEQGEARRWRRRGTLGRDEGGGGGGK